MKKNFIIFATLFLALTAKTVLAENLSAADSQSCQKMKGIEKPFILVLKKGENISDAILQCVQDAAIPSATLSGLGALESPTLSYFNHDTKKYQEKTLPGVLELVALSGNVTESNGKKISHLHVALSDEHYQMIGGHLAKATIGATAEIVVVPLKNKLIKKMNDDVGIELITTNL